MVVGLFPRNEGKKGLRYSPSVVKATFPTPPRPPREVFVLAVSGALRDEMSGWVSKTT
jgi:hypothetical protein